MQEHNTITLTVEEYRRLIVKAEQRDIIEGLILKDGYTVESDLKIILGIAGRGGEDNG